jgi:rhodanese-related sulfurtransferase
MSSMARFFRVATAACMTAVACVLQCAGAGPGGTPDGSAPAEVNGGPYCGVYCVYAALSGFGMAPNFEQLADRKYVGSEAGSSLAELSQACADFHCYSWPMTGLTASSLREAERPIVLHVRHITKGADFDHWVLFLGMEGDRARVIDPPNPVQLVSIPELLAVSDGAGLVISDAPIAPTELQAAGWIQSGVVILVVATLLTLMHAICRWFISDAPARASVRVRAAGIVAILLTTVGAAASWQALSGEGFVTNPVAVGHVLTRYFSKELEVIDVQQLREFSHADRVAIIDARLPNDFRKGHVPGAINIPITTGLAQRGVIFPQLAGKERVVVYCQSERCPWAESLGTDLAHSGVRGVAVFPGGWKEWRSHDR